MCAIYRYNGPGLKTERRKALQNSKIDLQATYCRSTLAAPPPPPTQVKACGAKPKRAASVYRTAVGFGKVADDQRETIPCLQYLRTPVTQYMNGSCTHSGKLVSPSRTQSLRFSNATRKKSRPVQTQTQLGPQSPQSVQNSRHVKASHRYVRLR